MSARARFTVRGAVQGVGFRPFVYRLATDLGLKGWVLNSSGGVSIEVEGEPRLLDEFLLRLERDRPPRAFIQSLESSRLDPVGFVGFEIRESAGGGKPTALVLPDIATCADCLREQADPADRRYRYPFVNCTNCGPRFSIIEALPYDRPNTSMRRFAMCDACRREYDDPLDRRFHAQPIACPACGPSIALWDADGRPIAREHAALEAAVAAIREGRILALKGLGGFQLIVDARAEAAVQRLRDRKHREEKPFALLFPGLAGIREVCEVSPLEARLLASPESPIVLLRRRDGRSGHTTIASNVAPRNPALGAMVPYTPLHHLLMQALGHPVVATSGNISDEPICTDELEALDRLRGIGDVFLVHNRPIVRHVDDSIVRVMAGRELVMRRARGYAPLPVALTRPAPPLLAVGAHLKNAVGVTAGSNFFISQHIGDLETAQANEAFRRAIDALLALYGVEPAVVAADLHPDYVSTRVARTVGCEVVQVQHHFAHVASCMAENELRGPVLGVSWDGTGYGLDGTVWGGEFLVPGADHGFMRVATFGSFRLPGGDRAIREPRRTAFGVLFEIFGPDAARMDELAPVAAFTPAERALLVQALEKRVNAPITTSAGRLFDAVSALVGLRQTTTFEGQSAMALEFAVDELETGAYPLASRDEAGQKSDPSASMLVLDWRPTVLAILDDLHRGVRAGTIAARFHLAMANAIVDVARRVALPRVVLTGGCFQNCFLLEQAIRRLQAAGFHVYWHQRVPPNDGGIALGQAAAALRMIE